jgi:DNA-binding PadR family transcriptional regulator
MTDIDPAALDRELKKGAAELLVLSVLDATPRHGYAGAAFNRLTPTGQRVLARQRQTWGEFVEAVRVVTRGEHA